MDDFDFIHDVHNTLPDEVEDLPVRDDVLEIYMQAVEDGDNEKAELYLARLEGRF